MKHVQACLSARKDGDLSFHNCGGHVKLVKTCLYARNTLQSRLNRPGGTCRPLQVRERLDKSVLSTAEVL